MVHCFLWWFIRAMEVEVTAGENHKNPHFTLTEYLKRAKKTIWKKIFEKFVVIKDVDIVYPCFILLLNLVF